jgi:hypothetical protein
VVVTESNTGTISILTTAGAGEYTAAALLPVGAGERVAIDVRLHLGDAAQTVEIMADAPPINTENASVRRPITTKEVEDLPLNGGKPAALAAFSIGVVATGQPGLIH